MRANTTKWPTLAIVSIMLFAVTVSAQAQSLEISGFGKSRFGFQTDDGTLFINDHSLETAIDWETDEIAMHTLLTLSASEDSAATFEMKELYMQWFGESFDLRLGKQPVIWGKADAVFITDQVSPKNLEDFLTRDFADLRLAVTGAKLDIFRGAHRLELVYLPVFTPTRLPAADSIWYVTKPFPVTPVMEEAVLPEASLENAEYFLRYSWSGTTADIQLVGGWYWSDTPVATITDLQMTPGVGLTGITIQPEYYQTALAGFAASLPAGPVMLKAEVAANIDQRLQAEMSAYSEGWTGKNTLFYMAGVEGSILGTTVSLQFIQDYVLDYEEALVRDELLTTATLAASRFFFRDTLKAEVLWYGGLNELESMIKPQLSWIPGNGFQAVAGGWFFLGETGQFGQYSGNNGIFITAAYYF